MLITVKTARQLLNCTNCSHAQVELQAGSDTQTSLSDLYYQYVFGWPQNIICLQAAAREKAAAGEGRNVEHVAEADDMAHTADTRKRKKTSSRQNVEHLGVPEPSQAKKRKSRQKAT